MTFPAVCVFLCVINVHVEQYICIYVKAYNADFLFTCSTHVMFGCFALLCFLKKMLMQLRVLGNETHLDRMLVSQVYYCMSGNDYFGWKGVEGGTQREVRENWNSC